MHPKTNIFIVLFLFFISSNLLGQVKLKDLQGYWVCSNKDSAYFKSDTLILIQFHRSNFQEENRFLYKYCEFYDWEIKKKDLRVHERQLCKEPTTEKGGVNYFLNSIEVIKSNNLTFIVLEKFGFKVTEVFLVLKLTTTKSGTNTLQKSLQLKRLAFIKR